MRFQDIHGLTHFKSQLLAGVHHNHIAHAQLFLGKPGSANLPMALAYATYLNCENPSETDACGQCPSCIKNSKFVHPDLHFSFPVAATDKIKGKDVISQRFLPDWRSFLLQNPLGNVNDWAAHFGGENKQLNISKEESRQIINALALKSFEGRYKIMLIWLPEYMHPSAANGILKILEEPPEKTIFILVCNNSEKLLNTILSRTQIVTVPSFSDEEVIAILTRQYGVDDSKAAQLAHLAEGDVHKAIALSSQVEDDTQKIYEDWMRECYMFDFPKLIDRAEEFHRTGKFHQQHLLSHAIGMFREATVQKVSATDLLRVPDEHKKFVENFSKTLSIEKVMHVSELISEASYHLERNASPKITFLNLSLDIGRTLKSK